MPLCDLALVCVGVCVCVCVCGGGGGGGFQVVAQPYQVSYDTHVLISYFQNVFHANRL